MKITGKETLAEFYEQTGMKDRSYMADRGMETLLARTIGEEQYREQSGGRKFDRIPVGELLDTFFASWNKGSILEGMEFLSEKLEKGQVFYDIYTEQEMEEDPAKRNTGLAIFPASGKRPYVMICPGGGYYSVCSLAEGYAIAKSVNEMGYPACVLVYRIGTDAQYPNPMEDLARAVRFMTEKAETFGMDPDGYALMGFSAGGHLAAAFGTESLGYARYTVKKPACVILAYPVITMGPLSHAGSREYLLGKEECERKEKQIALSVEEQVTADYPPVFVWQCEGDPSVPIANTRMLAESLKQASVPFIYETFPGEAHGWGLGTGTAAEGWLERALAFWGKNLN